MPNPNPAPKAYKSVSMPSHLVIEWEGGFYLIPWLSKLSPSAWEKRKPYNAAKNALTPLQPLSLEMHILADLGLRETHSEGGTRMTLRLPDDLNVALDEWANAHKTSKNAAILVLLKDALEDKSQ